MVSLRTLERLTGVYHQRTRQYHLGETEQGSSYKTLQEYQPELYEFPFQTVYIPQQTMTKYHYENSMHANPVTTVVLYHVGHKGAEQEESYGKHAHRQARLHHREILFLYQP